MSEVKHYSLSERDDWLTPTDFVEDIDAALDGIDLDPCAHEVTSHGTVNYRLEDDDDGLEEPWFGDVFVNPPFSYKADFLEKAVAEYQEDNVGVIVVLTPDGTDRLSWWHGSIAPHARYVCFLEGRLEYERAHEEVTNKPTFGTAVSVFADSSVEREKLDDLCATLDEWGQLMRTVEIDYDE